MFTRLFLIAVLLTGTIALVIPETEPAIAAPNDNSNKNQNDNSNKNQNDNSNKNQNAIDHTKDIENYPNETPMQESIKKAIKIMKDGDPKKPKENNGKRSPEEIPKFSSEVLGVEEIKKNGKLVGKTIKTKTKLTFDNPKQLMTKDRDVSKYIVQRGDLPEGSLVTLEQFCEDNQGKLKGNKCDLSDKVIQKLNKKLMGHLDENGEITLGQGEPPNRLEQICKENNGKLKGQTCDLSGKKGNEEKSKKDYKVKPKDSPDFKKIKPNNGNFFKEHGNPNGFELSDVSREWEITESVTYQFNEDNEYNFVAPVNFNQEFESAIATLSDVDAELSKLILQEAEAAAGTRTVSQKMMMGATVAPGWIWTTSWSDSSCITWPHLHWQKVGEIDWGIFGKSDVYGFVAHWHTDCIVWISVLASAGVDVGIGLRLPVEMSFEIPTGLRSNQEFEIPASITPLDFSAQDYRDFCNSNPIKTHGLILANCENFVKADSIDRNDGDEFFMRAQVFADLKLELLGATIFNNRLDYGPAIEEVCTMYKTYNEFIDEIKNPTDPDNAAFWAHTALEYGGVTEDPEQFAIDVATFLALGVATDSFRGKANQFLKDNGVNCGSFTTPFGYDDSQLTVGGQDWGEFDQTTAGSFFAQYPAGGFDTLTIDNYGQPLTFPFLSHTMEFGECAEARFTVYGIPICIPGIESNAFSFQPKIISYMNAGSNLITANYGLTNVQGPTSGQLKFNPQNVIVGLPFYPLVDAPGVEEPIIRSKVKISGQPGEQVTFSAGDLTYYLNQINLGSDLVVEFGGYASQLMNLGDITFNLYRLSPPSDAYGIPIPQHFATNNFVTHIPVDWSDICSAQALEEKYWQTEEGRLGQGGYVTEGDGYHGTYELGDIYCQRHLGSYVVEGAIRDHYNAMSGGTSGSAWTSLGGSGFSSVTAIQEPDQRMAIWGSASPSEAWLNYQTTPGGSWAGWSGLGGSVYDVGIAHGVNNDNVVFAVGEGGIIYHKWWTGSAWSDWVSLGGSGFTRIDAIQEPDQRMAIVGSASPSEAWLNYQTTPGGAWAGWSSLGGSVSDVAIAHGINNDNVIFGVGDGGTIYHKWWTGSAWSDWVSLGGTGFEKIDAVGKPDGTLWIIGGSAGASWEKHQTSPGGAWTDWTQVGDFGIDVAIGLGLNDDIVMYGLSPSGEVFASVGQSGGTNLGYPTSEQNPSNDKMGGVYSNFEHGAICWNPALGAYDKLGGVGPGICLEDVCDGKVFDYKYWTVEEGRLGQGGYVIEGDGVHGTYALGDLYCQKSLGIFVVEGEIRNHYNTLGAGASYLGYPVTDQFSRGDEFGGIYNNFEHGAICWNSQDGTWDVPGGEGPGACWVDVCSGKAMDRYYWTDHSGRLGQGGYVIEGDGMHGTYELGDIYCQRSLGSYVVEGGIRDYYNAMGAGASYLGYPVTNQSPSDDEFDGVYNNFEHGAICWNSQDHAWDVSGGSGPGSCPVDICSVKAMDRYYWTDHSGRLGQGGYVIEGDGMHGTYALGDIYCQRNLGSYVVEGAIRDQYNALGADSSHLGYPITNQLDTNDGIGGKYNNFEHGVICWNPQDGVWDISGGVGPDSCPVKEVLTWNGNGNANELTGTNNGALVGGTTFASGVLGDAFSFDGIDDSVSIPDAANLNPDIFSVETWVYPTGMQGQHRDIISKDGECADRQILLTAAAENRFRPHVWTDAGLHYFDSSTPVEINRWYHVVATYDGSTLALYVNGVPDGTALVAGNIVTTTQPIRIGGGSDGCNPFHFQGLIDEATFYNYVLSASEIQSKYSALSPSILNQDESFVSPDGSLMSPNGQYSIHMQGDGNLVTYGPDGVVWASNTNGIGTAPYSAVMQSDGNFCAYPSSGGASFCTSTNALGSTPYKAVMQDDGKFVIFDGNDDPLWSNGDLLVQPAPQPLSDWVSLGGSGFSSVTAIQEPDQRMAIWGSASPSEAWLNYQTTPGGSWAGWSGLGGSVYDVGIAHGVNNDNVVFAVGEGGIIYHKWWTGSAWSDWVSLGGSGFTRIDAIQEPDQRMAIVGSASPSEAWLNYQTTPGGAWAGWSSLGGSVSDVAIAHGINNDNVIFGVGDGGTIYHKWWTGSAWSDWVSLGGTGFEKIDAVGKPDGTLWIIGGSAGASWEKHQTSPGGAWTDWTQVGDFGIDVAIGLGLNDDIVMYAINSNGEIFHQWGFEDTSRADDDFFDDEVSEDIVDLGYEEILEPEPKPVFDIMDSEMTTSTYGKQSYSYGLISTGTKLTEINSGQICGLSLCSEKLSKQEKIQLYLSSRGWD